MPAGVVLPPWAGGPPTPPVSNPWDEELELLLAEGPTEEGSVSLIENGHVCVELHGRFFYLNVEDLMPFHDDGFCAGR
jgi:hypothetical protein